MSRGIGITWHPEDLQDDVEYHWVIRMGHENHDRHDYGKFRGIEFDEGKYWVRTGKDDMDCIYLPHVMEVLPIKKTTEEERQRIKKYLRDTLDNGQQRLGEDE